MLGARPAPSEYRTAGMPTDRIDNHVTLPRWLARQGRPVNVKHGQSREKTKTQRGVILMYYYKFAVIFDNK